MAVSAKNWIVETDWLAAHLNAPDLIVFDGSWHLPTAGRDAKAEYLAEHIPGALFFDIDDLVDEKSPLPHMLPSTVKFASRMKKMGVGDGMRIVVYDTLRPLLGRARLVDVPCHGPSGRRRPERRPQEVEGRGAQARGRPAGSAHRAPLHAAAQRLARARPRRHEESYVAKGDMQIVDARPKGRFEGTEPEPRPGLRQGHIPGLEERAVGEHPQCRRDAEIEGRAREALPRRRHRCRKSPW